MNSIKIDQIQPWSCYFFWLQPYSGAGGGGLILPKLAQYIGFFYSDSWWSGGCGHNLPLPTQVTSLLGLMEQLFGFEKKVIPLTIFSKSIWCISTLIYFIYCNHDFQLSQESLINWSFYSFLNNLVYEKILQL